jgi:pimeloyl-ACP methyl ester carboxylesterase
VEVRGVDLHVRDEGAPDGRLVVFGHGLLASMAQDDAGGGATVPVRPGGRVRVVRYDARGHGESAATRRDGDYRWRALALDMLAVLDAVSGPDARAVLGGASMGCATALHAAVLAPARVDALVLVIPPTARGARRKQALLYRAGAAMISAAGMAPFARMARVAPAPRILQGDLAGVHRAAIERMATLDRAVVPHVLRGAAASDLPPAAALAAVEVPALVLAWEGDPTHPTSTAQMLAANLPRAELHVASDAAAVRGWPDLVDAFLTSLRP